MGHFLLYLLISMCECCCLILQIFYINFMFSHLTKFSFVCSSIFSDFFQSFQFMQLYHLQIVIILPALQFLYLCNILPESNCGGQYPRTMLDSSGDRDPPCHVSDFNGNCFQHCLIKHDAGVWRLGKYSAVHILLRVF